jgi:hypothetical protein
MLQIREFMDYAAMGVETLAMAGWHEIQSRTRVKCIQSGEKSIPVSYPGE